MSISEMDDSIQVFDEDGYVRGDRDAAVTLVEYGEFECPDCGRSYHVVKRLLEELPGEVKFVFRHFARDDVHPFSERSAEAAEAAGAQGRFWEMHDFLFEHQHQLEYEDLAEHAAGLGLDVERFKAEIASHEHLPKVRSQLAEGGALRVSETPTFFIDGVRYDGPKDLPSLAAAVKRARGPR